MLKFNVSNDAESGGRRRVRERDPSGGKPTDSLPLDVAISLTGLVNFVFTI